MIYHITEFQAIEKKSLNSQSQFEPVKIMESSAFFVTIFLWCLLLSITGYSIYVGFGPPSEQLRDPFDEHED